MDSLVIIIAFVLAPVVVVSTVEAHAERNIDIHSSRGENRPEWDRLLLVIQWPPSVCRSFGNECRSSSVKNNWTIHGLWPNQGSSPKPTFCNNSSKFKPEELKDLRKAMEKTWGTLDKSKTNNMFWAHEWRKHGTCAVQLDSIHTEHNYFERTLNLSSGINLYSMLARANIRPSKTLYYPSASVRSAIHKGLGHTMGMYCTTDYGPNALMEVRICHDLSFNIIECKKMYGSECDPKRKIMIPPKQS